MDPEHTKDAFGRGNRWSNDSAARCSNSKATTSSSRRLLRAPSTNNLVAASRWPAGGEQEWSELVRLAWGTSWARPGTRKRERAAVRTADIALCIYI